MGAPALELLHLGGVVVAAHDDGTPREFRGHRLDGLPEIEEQHRAGPGVPIFLYQLDQRRSLGQLHRLTGLQVPGEGVIRLLTVTKQLVHANPGFLGHGPIRLGYILAEVQLHDLHIAVREVRDILLADPDTLGREDLVVYDVQLEHTPCEHQPSEMPFLAAVLQTPVPVLAWLEQAQHRPQSTHVNRVHDRRGRHHVNPSRGCRLQHELGIGCLPILGLVAFVEQEDPALLVLQTLDAAGFLPAEALLDVHACAFQDPPPFRECGLGSHHEGRQPELTAQTGSHIGLTRTAV